MANPNTGSEVRHMRSGSLSIQTQGNGQSNGMMSPMTAVSRFDGPRSPPNTSHVPCKFFRQGACQAGNACPFNHDLGAASENVCKYFAKGNCKFGPKCANIHVLPDGRRVNYGKNGVTIGVTPINLGSRVNPSTYGHHTSNSALTNSFMRGDIPAYTATAPYAGDDRYGHPPGLQLDNGLPTIDTTYSPNPASAYGSPRDEDTTRFGIGLSPAPKGLSVLDAPLPASFDSNGISHAARYGPWPASVPSKFGLESPSHSLGGLGATGTLKDTRTSDTLKSLHTSAFGSSDRLGEFNASGGDLNGLLMGRSPPIGSGSLLSRAGAGAGAGDEYFGKRPMHSSSLRYAKPRMISSSAPKFDHEWEESEFMFEEDYVPGALVNEVLTPDERARRGSNTNTLRGLDEGETPSMSLGASPITAPAGLTKFGSPSAGSPSRWGSWFQKQKEDESLDSANSTSNGWAAAGGSTSRSMKHAASAFGHVGSPLRNSSLASGLGPGFLNGSNSPARPASGSRSGSAAAGETVSALTQQLRRSSLADDADAHLHPNTARNGGPGTSVIGRERERDRGLERHVSSGSISSSVTGRFTTPIDEEDAAFLFKMEEEDDPTGQARSRKRISGGPTAWGYPSASTTTNGAAGGNNGISLRENGAQVEGR